MNEEFSLVLQNSKVGSTALASGKTITGLLGNTDISSVGSTVTGAIANIVTNPLSDPDMFSSTGWMELSWNTSFVNQHKGGYKVKGNYVYINCFILPSSTSPGNPSENTIVANLPSSYLPLDYTEACTIVSRNRYPASIYINSSNVLNLGGMRSPSIWLGIIGWYRYR